MRPAPPAALAMREISRAANRPPPYHLTKSVSPHVLCRCVLATLAKHLKSVFWFTSLHHLRNGVVAGVVWCLTTLMSSVFRLLPSSVRPVFRLPSSVFRLPSPLVRSRPLSSPVFRLPSFPVFHPSSSAQSVTHTRATIRQVCFTYASRVGSRAICPQRYDQWSRNELPS
eukprot:3216797-Prymnesium_polylepis.1